MAILFEYGQHEELGNGVFRTILSPRPVNYLNGGVWQPINSDWVDGDATYPHLVTAAPLMVSSDGTGGRRLHPTHEEDVFITLGRIWHRPAGTWVQAPMNALTRNGKRLSSINTNYDLLIDMFGHGLKFDLIPKGGFWPNANTIAFPASLTGLTRIGRILYKDGVPVAYLNPPAVYDLNDPEKRLPIAISFGPFGSQTGVIFGLPTPAQLTAAGITAPVIDPTLTLQPDATAGIDTFVQENLNTFNFGTATSIQVGQGASGGSKRRGLLKFDISALPGGATITVADLTLRCDTEDAATDYVVGAHRALTAFFEGVNAGATPGAGVDGSTWQFRNHNGSVAWAGGAGGGSGSDYEASATDSETITAATAFFTWNVLADVQAWYGGTTNNGWWLINTSETTTSSRKNFASSDHATAGNRPQLAITYTVGSGGGLFWPGVLESAVFGGAIVR